MASDEAVASAENPRNAEVGDLAMVNYTIKLEDGTLVRTTQPEATPEAASQKLGGLPASKPGAGIEILAGEPSDPPGLGKAVLGMGPGEAKHFELSPDQAYGQPDPRLVVQLQRTKTLDRKVKLFPREYVDRFNRFPIRGQEVKLVPYFGARVLEIGEREVFLEFEPRDGELVQDDFGESLVRVNGDMITVTLTPRLGAFFELEGRKGTITSFDDNTFTVDCNDPLKGKSLLVDLEVVSLIKESDYRDLWIDWKEIRDEGISLSKSDDKLTVLVLYADWCKFCKRFFDETMRDPRVRVLRDRFVWAKVDSDRETQVKQKYGQRAFPLIIVLNSDGKVLQRIEGFKSAPEFLEELRKL
ncbi:MAG: thioredoxin fold domain-containing protein [Syntrophobacteraceae bacterium]